MVHGAIYDAVNAIDGGHEPYLEDVPEAPPNASMAAAAAAAAHGVLTGVPGEPGILDQVPLCTQNCTAASFTAATRIAIEARLDGLLATALANANDGNVAQGEASGAAAAEAMLEARDDDGRYPPASEGPWFTTGTSPGQWRPTPTANDPFGWVRLVDPFVVNDSTQFLSKGPHALTSGAYAKEYNEVKAVGEAGPGHRTPEQQAMADFFAGTNPVEMFHRSLRAYATQESLDVVQQALLYAKLGFAAADTFITTWEDKEHWKFWRPSTAIANAATDGNPKTAPPGPTDPPWAPLVANPPYPDHSSGYYCATGSLMQVAERFFCQGRTTFIVEKTPGGLAREYDHFRDVYADTIDVRIYQGLHFRSADEAGAKIGRDVAEWVEKHALRPVH
jgi:hypothetical protein